jgi:serine/threonine-protein kinase
MSVERGTTLDRYELLCHLARGGMANVWLGRLHSKPEFERLFAIKTVLPSEADSPVFRTMFLDEARIVSRIDHPNVVRVTDVGEHDGLPYLVMELIEGDSLDKLMLDARRAGGAIPLAVALRIATDACNGLAAAHDLVDRTGAPMNVVHRDMSPQNILVGTNGVAKVIDFGIAKGRDRTTAKTSTGVLKGKACYMPQEQACGEEVDARTDTWALGAVLYYLFAGRPPYKSDSELATLKMAITAAPIPPLPPGVPAPVSALVAKALSHDPAARFQTAGEMAVALERVMAALRAVASNNEVAAFVRTTMAGRLAARRELVAQAVAESVTRESKRMSAAIPIEVDVDVDADAERSSGTVGGAVRSTGLALPRDARPSRSRVTMGAFAALCVVLLALVAVLGRGRPSSAAGRISDRGEERPVETAATSPAPAPVLETSSPVPEPAASEPAPVTATPASAATATHAAPPRARPAWPAPKGAATQPKKSRDDEAGF